MDIIKIIHSLSNKMSSVEERSILTKFHLDNVYLEDRLYKKIAYPVITLVPCGSLCAFDIVYGKNCRKCPENDPCMAPTDEIIAKDIIEAIKNTNIANGVYIRQHLFRGKYKTDHTACISFINPPDITPAEIDNSNVHSYEELLIYEEFGIGCIRILHQLWSDKRDLSDKIILPKRELVLEKIIRAYYLNIKDYLIRKTANKKNLI